MPNNREKIHPYLRGYQFWAPIISGWINSPTYTEKAKEQFRLYLQEMMKTKDLSKIGTT